MIIPVELKMKRSHNTSFDVDKIMEDILKKIDDLKKITKEESKMIHSEIKDKEEISALPK